MHDKTPLEFDIERHEKFKTSVNVKTLLVALIISLLFFGGYTFMLKRELATIEQEALERRADFKKEKIELLRQIKHLQAKKNYSREYMNLRELVLSNNYSQSVPRPEAP